MVKRLPSLAADAASLQQHLHALAEHALSEDLDAREQEIVRLRYGLDHDEPHTLQTSPTGCI